MALDFFVRRRLHGSLGSRPLTVERKPKATLFEPCRRSIHRRGSRRRHARDNGGQALTLALDRTNPAVDPGNDSQCEAVDQRGVARPIDGSGNGNGNGGAVRDVGAFEFSGVSFGDGFERGDARPNVANREAGR
ncbi:choice-of-anchor Q domain-containing protein [Tahibacter sp.]|uniref:choice-of-anchor Q domain-containing protein n=1 Tax=Tahibacter sp. TaxID=2056211 RepID=UPI0039C8D211